MIFFTYIIYIVPIEKVWPKAMQHSDWARGAAGALQGHLGRFNFSKAMYSWFELSPQNNPSDWSILEFQ